MRIFRVVLAAALRALASATPTQAVAVVVTTAAPTEDAVVAVVTTVAPTESPLSVAESAKDQAKQRANQTLHVVIQEERTYDQADDSEDLIDQEVAQIEAAVSNTTRRWAKQRKRKTRQRARAKTRSVREHVRAAKSAAKGYKRAARELERLRRRSGLPEFVYERDFEQDEGQAEGWGDEAENYGDASRDHIEAFYSLVKNKLEQHIEQQQQAAEQQHIEQQQDDQGGDWDADENDQQGAGNQQAGLQRGRSQQGGSRQQEGSDRPDADRNSADQQSIVTGPGHVANAASAPLNLRAVGPSTANESQGFLLTFACIGSLASLAYAVQMWSRPPSHPANQQASEPLLGA